MKARFNPLYDDGVDIALPKPTIAQDATPGDRAHGEFVALVDAHGGAVLATLRRLCGNAHEADDLFQETAVRVWRNFDKRPWLRSPRAWLITIAYRAFLDSRRRGGRESTELIPDVIDHRHESAEELAQRNDMRSQIDRCLSELPLELQQVMALHYQGGLSIRQTATAMGASVATTKNRLHAALVQLRGSLK